MSIILKISIHSLRVEGDQLELEHVQIVRRFQSTPSVWRETVQNSPIDECTVFQSTPSVWRETAFFTLASLILIISIHSLRVEGDLTTSLIILNYVISIHSLRVEGDHLV